jgi:hypothetical protein
MATDARPNPPPPIFIPLLGPQPIGLRHFCGSRTHDRGGSGLENRSPRFSAPPCILNQMVNYVKFSQINIIKHLIQQINIIKIKYSMNIATSSSAGTKTLNNETITGPLFVVSFLRIVAGNEGLRNIRKLFLHFDIFKCICSLRKVCSF